ncbi:MAG: putative polyketide biosynthesis zinc-dependent hydrolase PksB [Candidatus Heimdallarchaeota archaeon LC_2]|nr:MAG: putative polyketide biosynthesis zinc-dependent hydrolase PksB [Candidatus Heimdallarchaeota archaeon LC_2]
MKTVKFYLDCLSAASYIVSSHGEAVVIDPQRDIEIYISFLRENKLKLKYVLETHLHADFVSGHLELARETNSQIVFGEKADAEFDHIAVKDNHILNFGNVEIKIIETPGHTPEGVCYIMKDLRHPNNELSVFTGDTLFAGDVGRPDLMDGTLSKEILAKMLYESLHNKLMVLPDNTKVYPAHGAGSSCGRSLTDVEYTTIGLEKQTNYALQSMSVEEFTKQVTTDQPLPPKYFSLSAQLNRKGLQNIDNILNKLQSFSAEELSQLSQLDDITIIDVRDPELYSKYYIPNSINIGLDGRYAEWLGSITSPDHRIIIIADPGSEREAAIRAARVGFDKVIGYLEGGIAGWINANRDTVNFRRIDPEEVLSYIERDNATILLDVRRPTEFSISHLPHAINIPLSLLESNLDKLDKNKKYVVHCAGGYRSVIASSILKRNGYEDVIDIRGGYDAILEKSIKIPHIH